MSPVNHFGPGVIGQEAYEENKRTEETGADVFGPGVLQSGAIGDALAAAAAAKAVPAPVSTEDAELLADAKKDPPPPAFTALSIPDLEKFLAANPAEFDRLYRGEFGRPEGARKGALGAFLSHEQTHANRPEVIEALVGMLKAKS